MSGTSTAIFRGFLRVAGGVEHAPATEALAVAGDSGARAVARLVDRPHEFRFDGSLIGRDQVKPVHARGGDNGLIGGVFERRQEGKLFNDLIGDWHYLDCRPIAKPAEEIV